MKSGRPVKYTFQTVQTGSDESRVALLLCLSGSGPRQMLPSEINPTYFVYELTLDGSTPSPTFLSLREDLDNFRIAYQDALAEIAKVHGSLKELDLFPAVPAPVAILCGRETLPKIHPALRVHDYDKKQGGFTYQLDPKGLSVGENRRGYTRKLPKNPLARCEAKKSKTTTREHTTKGASHSVAPSSDAAALQLLRYMRLFQTSEGTSNRVRAERCQQPVCGR